jgi:hypothetical protein
MKGKPGKKSKKELEKPKLFSQHKQEKPHQLTLFELLKDEEEYSHTVELYDFMPKYVWGKVKRVGGVYLPTLRREFECRGRKYSLEIAPARITDGNTEIECFPSKREEMVEDALRKMMAEGQGIFLDGEAGISFTLYQLQKELKNRGHSYSTQQIKQALTILARTSIELKSEDAEIEIYFSPIETLGFKGKNDEKQTFVRFSPLVTKSIQERTFRLINYEQVMSYKSVIARLLHKRLSHHYTQASMTDPYHFLLTTVIRDFGLTKQEQLRNNQIEVEKALDEMKRKNVVLNFKADKVIESGARAKLVDVKFSLQPHPFFVSDVKKANVRKQKENHLLQSANNQNT